MHICVDRHVVLREVVIHKTSELLIHHAYFVESHADAPYDSTHDLTSGRLRIQNTSARNSADYAQNLDCAEVFIDLYFGEDGRIGMPYVSRLLCCSRDTS